MFGQFCYKFVQFLVPYLYYAFCASLKRTVAVLCARMCLCNKWLKNKYRGADASLASGPLWWFWAPCWIFWELKVGKRFGLKTRGGGTAFPHVFPYFNHCM